MNARLHDEAIALAGRTRWHPRNLARAAHDFAASNPQFAVEALLVALPWIAAGYDHDITGLDVLAEHQRHSQKPQDRR